MVVPLALLGEELSDVPIVLGLSMPQLAWPSREAKPVHPNTGYPVPPTPSKRNPSGRNRARQRHSEYDIDPLYAFQSPSLKGRGETITLTLILSQRGRGDTQENARPAP